MDLTGSDSNNQQAAQRQKQQFEQLYEGSQLIIDDDSEEIINANLTKTGIELETKTHEVEIKLDK